MSYFVEKKIYSRKEILKCGNLVEETDECCVIKASLKDKSFFTYHFKKLKWDYFLLDYFMFYLPQ